MLSAALRTVADRLATALMAFVHALAPSLAPALAHPAPQLRAPELPQDIATALFHRLSHLIARLIQIVECGLPTPRAKPAANRPAAPTTDRPRASPEPEPHDPLANLSKNPGWLLQALPAAPALAAKLAAILADPAAADLLAAIPSLERLLRPILHLLTPPTPSRTPHPVDHPPQPHPSPSPQSPTPTFKTP